MALLSKYVDSVNRLLASEAEQIARDAYTGTITTLMSQNDYENLVVALITPEMEKQILRGEPRFILLAVNKLKDALGIREAPADALPE
jgi:hypothetical protein